MGLWPCVVIGGKKSKRDRLDQTKSTLNMSALCRHAQDSMYAGTLFYCLITGTFQDGSCAKMCTRWLAAPQCLFRKF